MAKTAKPKQSQPSLHSRAARRQSSPNLPSKSLPSTHKDEDQPWLYHAQNAGISKQKKKPKKLTRQQRVRHQRGLEHAQRNGEKLERKVEESLKRARKLKARSGEWEEAVGGKKVGEVVLVEGVEDGGEDGGDGLVRREKGKDGRTWAEKMVEVELEEAMDEIEGFALPGLGGEDAEAVWEDVEEDEEKGGPVTAELVVEDLDEVT